MGSDGIARERVWIEDQFIANRALWWRPTIVLPRPDIT